MADPQENISEEGKKRRREARLKRQKERRRKKIIRFCIAWGSVLAVIILVTVLVVSCAVNAGRKKDAQVQAETASQVQETTSETTTTEETTTAEVARTDWDGVTAQEMIDKGLATKIVFLTFDDGPGPYTDELLDVLARYNVKVTFFVTANGYDYDRLITREYQDGHSVAVHTLTHDYEKIYTSEDAYWADFSAMNDIIEENTGHRSDFFRFPGGASNEVSWQYNEGIMTRLTQEAIDRGLDYVDWDVSSGDGGATDNTEDVIYNVTNGIEEYDISVVLLHDTHEFTVNAIEDIIIYCQERGYTLLPFYKGIYECHHGVNN